MLHRYSGRWINAGVLVVGWFAAGMAFAASKPVEYRLTRSVALGAPDRWDYVVYDPGSGRVFVAHGDEVTVVSGEDGSIVGHVKGFPGGTHGIALDTAAGRGFTDDGKAGEAASFNLRTLAIEDRIKAAPDADAIAFDPASGHIFVVNGDSGSLTVIDPHTDKALATIAAHGGLEYAVADGQGNLYVNGAELGEVVRVDTRSNAITARWPLEGCLKPHGLAMDIASRRLFVSCVNSLMTVVDADSGEVIVRLPIGAGTDAAAFDPARRLIFSSNGRDGNVSVIQEVDARTYTPQPGIQTSRTARTMAVNPRTGRLFVAAADPATAAEAAASAHPGVVPGSLKLLFFDPVD